jgi:CBS domain-containing protein
MDIADAVTTEYVALDPSTPVSKLRGAFDAEAETREVVIEGEDGLEGVVSERGLLASHRSPDEKVRSIMRNPPRVSRTEDVREVARLMVENELGLLPVFEGQNFYGVVVDRDLLRLVQPYLDALDVEDVFTRDLVDVTAEATVGEVINTLRENGISRAPVVDGDEAVGVVSVHDLVDFAVRKMDREQGGSHEGFDEHGGTGSADNYDTHGGYGERAGTAARMLDLPIRDAMSTPVESIESDRPLEDATERMLEKHCSSLVVTSPENAGPAGIVTVTDLLRSLTWTEETHIPVQVFNVDLLDDLSREAIAERIEEIDGKYAEMDILETNVVLHKHEEQLRGTPLLLATVRLFTDRGRFSGSGEGYGATAAFGEAADILEENVLEKKGREHPRQLARKNKLDTERLVGWWLEE